MKYPSILVSIITFALGISSFLQISNEYHSAYLPLSTCFKTIIFNRTRNFNSKTNSEFSFREIPISIGDNKAANIVKFTACGDSLSLFTGVVGSNITTLCDETIAVVCCFHISSTKVIAVATGIPQN